MFFCSLSQKSDVWSSAPCDMDLSFDFVDYMCFCFEMIRILWATCSLSVSCDLSFVFVSVKVFGCGFHLSGSHGLLTFDLFFNSMLIFLWTSCLWFGFEFLDAAHYLSKTIQLYELNWSLRYPFGCFIFYSICLQLLSCYVLFEPDCSHFFFLHP